jgi:Fic family protein
MEYADFGITEIILKSSNEIIRILGRYDGAIESKPEPKLRRTNRIKTIQGSLAIEGNSLSLDQITALLSGKKVIGPKKHIQEALNANLVYDKSNDFDPYSTPSLLKAHGLLMKDILPDAGKWRSGSVGIMKGGQVSHIAPKAQYVQGMVKDLLKFVKNSKLSPLITSSLFHYEFEVIHPFSDGNGRMGRFWQHILLSQFHPLFEFIPVESIVYSHQKQYYLALEKADKLQNSTCFVEFMLDVIHKATLDTTGSMRLKKEIPSDRLNKAHEHFKTNWFSRKDYLVLFKEISTATASRDLKQGVLDSRLKIKGQQSLARYQFK